MARIVVLSRRSIIHPRGGGACRYVHEIFRRLTDRHSITILSSGGGDLGGKPIQEIDGIDYRHFSESSHRVLLPARYLAKFAGKTDLLIDNSDVGIPWLTPLYARTPRITIVHQLIREIFYQELPRPISDIGFISEPLLYRLYSGSRIVAVSQSTARELVDWGIPEDNVDVVSPGCTIPTGPRATLDERSPNTVGCVTRLMKYKGVQLAFMAFRRIVRESPRAKLVIAGAGPYQNELERIAGDIGMSKNVIFLGRVSDESKFKLYREARVMISPSQREGFGMSVIEANSVGTPVVGWDVPGLRDSIVHNETGFLAPFPDDQALAGEVGQLLNDDETWERLSQNAWKWASNHTWDQSASSFRTIIEATLAKAKEH